MPTSSGAKRHFISAILTFISGFTIALGVSLTELIGTTLSEDIITSMVIGAALTGLRAVFKYLNETFVQ